MTNPAIEEAPSYEEKARADSIAWRTAAYEALKAGPLPAAELGRKTVAGKKSDRILAMLAIRRAAKWPAYFRVIYERYPPDGTPTTIDLVPWDYHRRKTN